MSASGVVKGFLYPMRKTTFLFPYIGKVCYKSSPTNKMSSHTECSKTQPSGTHDKDTWVHMPWREQEAGCFTTGIATFPSSKQHMEAQEGKKRLLRGPWIIQGNHRQDWHTAPLTEQVREVEKRNVGFKKTERLLPPQAHLVPRLRAISLQRGRAEEGLRGPGFSFQSHLYLWILVVPVGNLCFNPSLEVKVDTSLASYQIVLHYSLIHSQPHYCCAA